VSQGVGAVVAMSAMVLYAKLSMEVKAPHPITSPRQQQHSTTHRDMAARTGDHHLVGGGGEEDATNQTTTRRGPRTRVRRQVSSNPAFII
jgi:hypothetical protein